MLRFRRWGGAILEPHEAGALRERRGGTFRNRCNPDTLIAAGINRRRRVNEMKRGRQSSHASTYHPNPILHAGPPLMREGRGSRF